MVSMMAFGAYTGPKEAARKAMSGMTYQCLDREMPSDWPGHANARLTAQRDLAAAAAIDPSLSSVAATKK
jgi:nitrate/TMAO reductase-like tetraheme cytochrome c subunit